LTDHIPANQFGFVKGRSTNQAVKIHIENIQNTVYLQENKVLYALFLDIKKAFDTVSRDFFFKKLVERQN
jgi:hypothetical protein